MVVFKRPTKCFIYLVRNIAFHHWKSFMYLDFFKANLLQTPVLAPTPATEMFTATEGIRVAGFAKKKKKEWGLATAAFTPVDPPATPGHAFWKRLCHWLSFVLAPMSDSNIKQILLISFILKLMFCLLISECFPVIVFNCLDYKMITFILSRCLHFHETLS